MMHPDGLGQGWNYGAQNKNFLRDPGANGNLVLLAEDTSAFTFRYSTDGGLTWSTPTGTLTGQAADGVDARWDANGDLHVIMGNQTGEPTYRKYAITRSGGDISSVVETSFALNHVTDSAMLGSWCIEIVDDDDQDANKQRVAIGWLEAKTSGSPGSQYVKAQMTVTTSAAGVSPTAAADFKAFDESAAVETIVTHSGTSAGSSTNGSWSMSLFQLPAGATNEFDLYALWRIYDNSLAAARQVALYRATSAHASTQPFWNSWASVTTGSTPAQSSLASFGRPIYDSNTSKWVFALQDTTSTTSLVFDFWTVDGGGTVDKTPSSYPDLTIAPPGGNPPRSWSLALDGSDLWLVTRSASSISNSNWTIAKLSGGSWTTYELDYTGHDGQPICLLEASSGNRLYFSFSGARTDGEFGVDFIWLGTAQTKTVKASGGDFTTWSDALERGMPLLTLADWTVELDHVSGGYGQETSQGVSLGPSNSFTYPTAHTPSGVTRTVRAASADKHARVFSTSKMHFSENFALWTMTGEGKYVLEDIQFYEADTVGETLEYAQPGLTTQSEQRTDVDIDRCIVKRVTTVEEALRINLGVATGNPSTVNVRSCVILQEQNIAALEIEDTGGATVTIDSCSIYNSNTGASAYGISEASVGKSALLTNNAVRVDSTTADVAISGSYDAASNYNAAGGSGGVSQNATGGANDKDDLSAADFNWNDPANDDLTLASASGELYNAGSTTVPFDIGNATRKATHEIGAYDWDANQLSLRSIERGVLQGVGSGIVRGVL